MTTQTWNIVRYNTQHPQHVQSTTLPHVDCCARLRASPHVSSELGYRPIRCRDTHPAASLPKKGAGRLPAYQQDYVSRYNVSAVCWFRFEKNIIPDQGFGGLSSPPPANFACAPAPLCLHHACTFTISCLAHPYRPCSGSTPFEYYVVGKPRLFLRNSAECGKRHKTVECTSVPSIDSCSVGRRVCCWRWTRAADID